MTGLRGDALWDKPKLAGDQVRNRRRALIVRRARKLPRTSPERRDPTGPLHPLASPDHDCASFGFTCCDADRPEREDEDPT